VEGLLWITDSPGWGGAEMNLLRVIDHLDCYKHTVAHSDELSQALRQELNRRRIDLIQIRTGNRLRDAAPVLLGSFLLARRFRNSPIIVWCHHTDTYRWGRTSLSLLTRRVLQVEQTMPPDKNSFRSSKLSVPLKRISSTCSKAIVVNGLWAKRHFCELFGVDSQKVHVILNARPIHDIHERVQALRRNATIPASLGAAVNLVCVARLNEQKDQASLIRAMPYILAKNSDVSLILVGDGEDRPALERLANQLAPKAVRFCGHQSDPLVWLAAGSIFLLVSRFEGVSGALIEAMAAQLPCIVTNIEANAELVRHGRSGILVPVEDPEKIAESVNYLLQHPKEAADLAKSGFEIVQHHYDVAAERNSWRTLIQAVSANQATL
jgi:glycosyltransferase involved in cell wall biosynthesis